MEGSRASSVSYDDGQYQEQHPSPVANSSRKSSRKSIDAQEKGPKPKRLKTALVTPGIHQIAHIPRLPNGSPQLPAAVGIMILKKLGGACA